MSQFRAMAMASTHVMSRGVGRTRASVPRKGSQNGRQGRRGIKAVCQATTKPPILVNSTAGKVSRVLKPSLSLSLSLSLSAASQALPDCLATNQRFFLSL